MCKSSTQYLCKWVVSFKLTLKRRVKRSETGKNSTTYSIQGRRMCQDQKENSGTLSIGEAPYSEEYRRYNERIQPKKVNGNGGNGDSIRQIIEINNFILERHPDETDEINLECELTLQTTHREHVVTQHRNSVKNRNAEYNNNEFQLFILAGV